MRMTPGRRCFRFTKTSRINLTNFIYFLASVNFFSFIFSSECDREGPLIPVLVCLVSTQSVIAWPRSLRLENHYCVLGVLPIMSLAFALADKRLCSRLHVDEWTSFLSSISG